MNFLHDIIPGPARKSVYAVLGLIAVGLGAWQVSEGDWMEFAIHLLTALGFGTAASNITGEHE